MHIVIVGGGTAGWLTAALALSLTEHRVTVLESSRIGIIGVGESTTGFFTDLFQHDLRDLGLDHDRFLIETGATCKLGIRHRSWTADPRHSYFGPLDGTATQFAVPDTLLEWALTNLAPEDLIKTSHTGYLIRHGLSNLGRDQQFLQHGHAMHIDGGRTGQYFSKHCLRNPRCSTIDTEVLDVARDSQGLITELICSGGLRVQGDLFIDCTGFARQLITAMGAQWISYRQWLPVDRGMPFLENYGEWEQPEAWTTAWAQPNGWMWTTPLQDRRGNGYVYSSDHITDDQAQAEIEAQLGRAITPVKIIKFDAGRQDRAWINNCVSIGLSSSFLEPLEATSIHTTICQIKMLFNEYCGDTLAQTLNPANISVYNRRWGNQLDDLRDFLVMHYQGGRQDSEFWRYISSGATRTDFVNELLTMSQDRVPSFNDFPRYWGVAGWSLYSWIMAGLGLFKNVNRNHSIDYQLDQESLYHNLQQEFAQRYSQNRTHEQYIQLYRTLRQQYLDQV